LEKIMKRSTLVVTLGIVLLATAIGRNASGADRVLPDAKPVPDMQVLPLPYDQAAFEHQGKELTRYHFGPQLRRPFWYPIAGPGGRSLTRMNMPGDPGRSVTQDVQPQDPQKPKDPAGHSHQTSVWISHKDVNCIDFWRDGGPIAGQIVHQPGREGLEYDDGPAGASMLSLNHWNDPQGKTLMIERRRATVKPAEGGSWWMIVDLQFEAPQGNEVTLGKTPFGPLGVRMAKTIGVTDGGGRILNSEGQRNEAETLHKPARWLDYSGPLTNEQTAGITLMDHPANANHPVPFQVRDNGWMGVALTLNEPLTITPGKPLRLRYALWVHPDVPAAEKIDRQWRAFVGEKLASMMMKPKPSKKTPNKTEKADSSKGLAPQK
jgi:hypothetical protein